MTNKYNFWGEISFREKNRLRPALHDFDEKSKSDKSRTLGMVAGAWASRMGRLLGMCNQRVEGPETLVAMTTCEGGSRCAHRGKSGENAGIPNPKQRHGDNWVQLAVLLITNSVLMWVERVEQFLSVLSRTFGLCR